MPHNGNGQTQGQFTRIKARQREADQAWMDEQRERDSDRLQQAIRFLRSERYIVAPCRNPDRWTCGRRSDLTGQDIMQLAERLGCPFERTIRERREATDGRRRGRGNGSRASGQ
jgi:hypothetical protein